MFLAKNETLADKKVLLLESAPKFKEPPKDKYSNRVSAINKQSIGLLKKLDAWDYIESIRCKPIMQMQVRNKKRHSNYLPLQFTFFCIGLGRNIWRNDPVQSSELRRQSRLHRGE